jgi:23S rRNA (cytosine1962-C5)-methyltransferase
MILEMDINSGQIINCLRARLNMLDETHRSAVRLYNGFYEGDPKLAVDLYGQTLVIQDYRDPPGSSKAMVEVFDLSQQELPWLKCAIWKPHNASDAETRRGRILWGSQPDRKICENNVWYAVDLLMHQDTSLYLDTRGLRWWLKENCSAQSVPKTFACTGSLGTAALAGGAVGVVQTDLNREYLNLAKTTYSLNGFLVKRENFIAGDFFPITSHLRRQGAEFDNVILDPPFFSSTSRGAIDLQAETSRLINKVRPLVANEGRLIMVNNSVFLPGKAFIQELAALTKDGYVEIEKIIPVPQDFTGTEETRFNLPFIDPAPFNHSTKIVILKIKRKMPGRSNG